MGRGVSRCQRLSKPAHRWYASPHTLALHRIDDNIIIESIDLTLD